MLVSNLIKALQEYEINEHGKPAHIRFYDIEGEHTLELMPQDDDWDPGINHDHNMGCGCVVGYELNFRWKK